MTVRTKSEETRQRILTAALDLFRAKGFWETTMREVAAAAGVATGAAYYYFDSKEAIVLAFYDTAERDMRPLVDSVLEQSSALDATLHALIEAKLKYFEPNRKFLGALLGHAANRHNPLSPFGESTSRIRDVDIESFRRALEHSGFHPPKDLAPHLPGMLWAFQMSIVFFWLTDSSDGQARTRQVLAKSTALIARLLKLSALPLMRPLRKSVIELVELVKA